MFTELDGNKVVWSDGERETVNAVILATGFRPSLDYLHELGALTQRGPGSRPRRLLHARRLVYLGLEFPRSFPPTP